MPSKDGPVFKTFLPEAPEQPRYYHSVTDSDDKKAENGTCSREKSDSMKSDCESTWRSLIFARQVYSFLVVSLLALHNGYSLAFSSPLLEEMLKGANSTPWKDGFDQCVHQSMIGPSVLISAAFGGFCSFLLIGLFGLVPSMIFIAVTFTTGWTMIGVSWFVSSPSLFRGLILTGRVITGVANGLTNASTTVYVGEVSPSKYRAWFMGLIYVTHAIGVIMAYILGSFLSYWICAFIYGGITLTLIPFLAGIQESPSQSCNPIKNAKQLVTAFKTNIADFDIISWRFPVGSLLKRIATAIVIFIFHSFMGYLAIIQYIGPILNVAGASDWSIPHGVLIALTVGGGEFIGSILATIISQKLNRIMCVFIGAIGTCIGHVGVITFFVLVDGFGPQQEEDLSGLGERENVYNNSSVSAMCFFEPAINADLGQRYSPIALIGITVVMLMFGSFWAMQPYLITIELFPDETRQFGVGIAVFTQQVSYIILSFLIPFLESVLGTALLFSIFALNALLAAILIPTFVPETKGRPMGERGDKFTPMQNWMEFFEPIKTLCKWTVKICKNRF